MNDSMVDALKGLSANGRTLWFEHIVNVAQFCDFMGGSNRIAEALEPSRGPGASFVITLSLMRPAA